MNVEIGAKFLVTTDAWFYASDGKTYRGVWGTVKGVHRDQDVLGIKTNAKSTNWYLEIGDTILAGCQIHYAVRCDEPPPPGAEDHVIENGRVCEFVRPSNVWNADARSYH